MARCEHYVSTPYVKHQVFYALGRVYERLDALREHVGLNELWRYHRALDRIADADGTLTCPARWSTRECADLTFLLEALEAIETPKAVYDVLDSCVEALACGYWNGDAACEDSECDLKDGNR